MTCGRVLETPSHPRSIESIVQRFRKGVRETRIGIGCNISPMIQLNPANLAAVQIIEMPTPLLMLLLVVEDLYKPDQHDMELELKRRKVV